MDRENMDNKPSSVRMMEITVDSTGLSINLLNIRNNLSVKKGKQ
jgi:hypothetical protein